MLKEKLKKLTELASKLYLYNNGETPEEQRRYAEISKQHKGIEQSIIKDIRSKDAGLFEFSFRKSSDLNEWDQLHLFTASPGLFIAILETYPGELYNIAGETFLAVPEILEAAIQNGEPVPLRIGEQEYMKPAIRIPFRRVENVAAYYPDFYPELDEDDPYDRYFAEEMKAFEKCIRLLSSIGSDVNDRNVSGRNLLSKAMDLLLFPAKTWAFRILIQYGALPDLITDFLTGETCLHKATSRYYSHDMGIDEHGMQALLDTPFPIDLGVNDYRGHTPLDECVFPKRPIEVFRLLLERERIQRKKFRSYSTGLFDYGFKQPLLYRLAQAGSHPQFEDLCDLIIDHIEECRNKELAPKGRSLTVKIHKDDRMPYHDGKYYVDHRSERMIDVILENREGKFSERVVTYFRKKKQELGID